MLWKSSVQICIRFCPGSGARGCVYRARNLNRETIVVLLYSLGCWHFSMGGIFFGNYFVSVLGIFLGVSVSLVLCISAVLLLCVLLFCFSAFPCFCCYPSLLPCFSTVLLLYFFLICCFSSLTKPQETQYKYALPQTSPPEN